MAADKNPLSKELKKLNYQTTIDYAKCTNDNLNNLDALTLLLLNRNHIEYLERYRKPEES